MLDLASDTDPTWTRRALDNLDAILLDHAHCERKAASTALSLIFKYTDQTSLMIPLSELAREELRHFEEVIGHVERRGGHFGRQKPSPYAGQLMEACRTHEPERLLDVLIICSLIES
ncbi:MAG: tRNA-(ms[2]io[6]A)-hydroxylase, partial [Planctomycetes bacterium]|nr:tRNA-(ms[2]io[6]A)-hydroxylase [Planctomycetota bacterium]